MNILLKNNVRILFYFAIILPVRISFLENDSGTKVWLTVDSLITGLLCIDIFVNFFSAYLDSEENLVFDNKVKDNFMYLY